jgi:hypothetical protein
MASIFPAFFNGLMGPLLGRKNYRKELVRLACINRLYSGRTFVPAQHADRSNHAKSPTFTLWQPLFEEMKSLLYYHIVHFHVRAVDSMSK